MEPTKYKSLGNTIREAVHNIKDAPTMLPDETIEKLGLTEDDILTVEDVEDVEELDEAKKHLTVNQTMKVLDVLEDLRVKGSTKSDLKFAVKALKTIDGMVNFNVKKHIKTLLAAADSLFVLEKLAEVESDRLDSTEEGVAASHRRH